MRSRTARLWHDVGAIDDNPLVFRCPHGDMKRGPLLGHVDVTAAEHGVDALDDAAFIGKPQE
jgi:hypothetical protein